VLHDFLIARAGAETSRDNAAQFQKSSLCAALWQITNSFLPYALLWFAMVRALLVSYWLMLPLALLAAGFLVRIFIIFHDCGHASFFRSRRANNVIGVVAGLLLLTPYRHWRWQHALHHGTAGDLDRRGEGDMWTLTVHEYLVSSWAVRCAYRLVRNPLVLFVVGPLFTFVIHHRFSSSAAPARVRYSVWKTNAALLGATLLMSSIVGFKSFVLIQLTVSAFAGSVGLWLFYVQHQFKGAYWARSQDWNFDAAALEGSSFYKLPRVLQWFTGNIGFHHIHHLNPRIPNYRLARCHDADPYCRAIQPLTLRSSLKSLTLRLWDERQEAFVSFRQLRLRARPLNCRN
jgi:omega-6 fatty acid desaturase (delta-12 desaturase)